MIKTRPFLKWAGSKYNCLEKIIPALPKAQRLIEPFGGSGAVFLNSHHPSYLLAESNFDLINLFTLVKEEGNDFIQSCRSYFTPQFNNAEHYYQLRQKFNQLPFGPERAAIFIYLNRHGYNGLCRYNSKGGYNVPFGLHPKPYFPEQEMNVFHEKSQKAHFVHQDFRKTFAEAQKGDVIYCDPPYVPLIEQKHKLPYTPKPFTTDDQIELAELAQKTASNGIPVIISNHDTAFTRQYYKQAKLKSFPVTRVINCQGHLRQPVKELLAIFKIK